MRGRTIMALLVLTAVSLAGCTEEEPVADDTEECTPHVDPDCEHGHEDGDHNETKDPPKPNVPPTAVLTLTDAAGNTLDNTTYVMAGEEITFSAEGSTDSDGNITLAGLSVVVGNNKNDVITEQLIVDGALTPVTLNFTNEGRVLAVLSILDDEGGRGVAIGETYVNVLQTESFDIDGAEPSGEVVKATDCTPPGSEQGSPIIGNQVSGEQAIDVANGTRWITAKVVGDAHVDIAICDPDGKNLSGEGTEVETDDIGPLDNSVKYTIFAVAREPDQAFDVEVIVHWEPKPAA